MASYKAALSQKYKILRTAAATTKTTKSLPPLQTHLQFRM
jgi:hypothetical protein